MKPSSETENLFTVLRQSAKPKPVSAIERLIEDAPDRDLCRINALAFAARHKLDEEDVIATFLHGARLGIFDMSWNILCPACGGILDSGATLKTVKQAEYTCVLCAEGCEPTLDEIVEVTFTISPRVRRIAAHDPGTLPCIEYYRQIFWSSGVDLPDDDTLAKWVKETTLDALELSAGDKAALSLQLPEGYVIVFDPVLHMSQHIEVKGEPTRESQWQLKGGRVMQVDISPGYRRIRIATKDAQERIKGRGRVCIEQRVSQTRLADLTNGQVLSLVASVAEAQFPVPRLEIIAKLAHLTLQSNIEEHIPVGKLLVSGAGVINATKPDASSHRDWDSVDSQSRIPYGERIKRILDWHADAGGAKSYGSSRSLKWVRRKRNSRQGCIEKRSRNFEIGKYRQVLVAQIAGERAVERLAIRRWQRWRESREVKEQVVPIPGCTVYNAGYRKWIGIKWRRRDVRSTMRFRSVRAETQSANQTFTVHSAREIPAANVESSKWNKIAVA